MKRYEISKEQWERIQPLLPPEKPGKRGRPRKDKRIMLNGMLWIARSGAQWRDDGTLEAVFHALSVDADIENLSIDSTCVKVYESANGEKTADKAVGRTRGEWNTKLYTVFDGLENPEEFPLSAGNDHDPVRAVERLEKVRIRGRSVLSGRAYGARTIREYISARGASYVIPPQSIVSDP